MSDLTVTGNMQSKPSKAGGGTKHKKTSQTSRGSAADRDAPQHYAGVKRKAADDGGRGKAAKQPKKSAQRRPGSAPSKFEELLGDLNVRNLRCFHRSHWGTKPGSVSCPATELFTSGVTSDASAINTNTAASIVLLVCVRHLGCEVQPAGGRDAEATLQRRLAKKLGLTSRRAAMGGDDGLDDLLDGLDGLDSETASDSGDGTTPGGEHEGASSGSDDDGSEGSSESDEDTGDLDMDADSDGGAEVARLPMNGRHANGARPLGEDESDATEDGLAADESAEESGSAIDDEESFGLTSGEEPGGDRDGSDVEHVSAERRRSGADASASGRPVAVQAGVRRASRPLPDMMRHETLSRLRAMAEPVSNGAWSM